MVVVRDRLTLAIPGGVRHVEAAVLVGTEPSVKDEELRRLAGEPLLERELLVDTENVSAVLEASLHPLDACDEGVALAYDGTDALNHIVTFLCVRDSGCFGRKGRFPFTTTDLDL